MQVQRLSEQDAWAIAMTWQPQLQGKVRLEVDHDRHIDSIIEHYAWVRIDQPRSLTNDQPTIDRRREAVSIMRAVMLTWAALASCPGYSGSENPAFWKRVVSELQPEPIKPRRPRSHRGCHHGTHDPRAPVTDTKGFFDLPGMVFPRFMAETPYPADEPFKALFTPSGPELTPDVRTQMETILATLATMHQMKIESAVVDICLRVYGFFGEGQDRPISALVRSTDEGVDAGANVPRFRISHIRFRDSVGLRYCQPIDDMINLIRNSSVSIHHFYSPLELDHILRSNRACLLQALLRTNESEVKATLTSFEFARHSTSNADFQALMSTLPFATSLHSLTFSTEYSSRGGTFEQADLPWVAYAIFHPRAKSSSWRHLTVKTVILTPHSAHVMAAMAKGNNLLALLNGTPPESDAYYSGQVRPGTVVQLHADPGSEALFIAPLEGASVDVCGISSLDRATWGEWVAVIVPAYGLGWVRQHELTEVRTHAPACQSVSSFRLLRNYNPASGATDNPPEVLLHLLPPLGHFIEYLDISSYLEISPATLEAILRVTPSLKVLVVSHSGQLWSESLGSLEPLGTTLEELEMVVSMDRLRVETPTLDHIQKSLRSLRALRLRVHERDSGQLQASRATLEQLLYHAPSLRYVHWRNDGYDYSSKTPVPYTNSLQWTPRALTELNLTDDKYLYAQEPIRASCAAAFLSVVAAAGEHGGSAVGRIVDRGVLTTIFEFATSPVKRFIHIEPDCVAKRQIS